MQRKFMRTPFRLLLRLTNAWKRRFGVVPIKDSMADMNTWFRSPLGQALVAEEKQLINESLSCVFGYHLLQLGVDASLDMSEQCRISHKFSLHPQHAETDTVSALVDFNHLPLAAESIDAVILHHALDYSQSPHHLLREATRVIIPRGHLVIVGFNPWSLWGMGAYISRFFTKKPRWRHQYLRLGRLLDWLSLVDLEPVEVIQGYYRPPLSHPNAIKHLQWMEAWGKRWRLPWGGFYMIVARKDHLALTPLKPEWQAVPPLGGLTVPRILGQKPQPVAPRQPQHVNHDGQEPDSVKAKNPVEERRNIH